MSWDALIYRFDGEPPRTKEEWERIDALMKPLGVESEIRENINSVLSPVHWNEPLGCWLNRESYTMWLRMWQVAHEEEQIGSIGVTVYGNGDPLKALRQLCVPNGWVVLDYTTGDWVDWDHEPDSGFQRWVASRDETLRTSEQEAMPGAPEPGDSPTLSQRDDSEAEGNA